MAQKQSNSAPTPPPAPATPQPTPAATTPTNGLAVASLVTGILALLSGWLFVGGALGIAAIVLGIIAMKKPGGKGMSIAGIIMGALGIIGAILITIFWIFSVAFFSTAANEAAKNNPDYSHFQEKFDKHTTDIKVAVGETATIDDTKMTINGVERMDSLDELLKADTGNVYLVASVTLENTGGTPASYSTFDFKLKTAAGDTVGPALMGAQPTLGSGDLAAGASASGKITFEVPVESADQFIIWQPNLFGSTEAVVKIPPQ